jgi:hypothetical protein
MTFLLNTAKALGFLVLATATLLEFGLILGAL